MDGSTDAGRDSKVAGIVEQVRGDMQLRPTEESQRLLKQRLDDAGIEVSDDELTALTQEVQGGDGSSTSAPPWEAR